MADFLTDPDEATIATGDVLAVVLRTVAQPVWVVDHDGLIRYANPAAVEALGYDTADELRGRQSHETIHYKRPDGAPYPASECPMLLPRTTGERVARDLDWFFRRDGSMFPVSYVSVPIDMPEGRGAVVAFTDVEERRRAEEALREREAELEEEQAALRRVATLVARGAEPRVVYDAVCEETGRLLDATTVNLAHFTPDGINVTIAGWSLRHVHVPTGTRLPLDGDNVNVLVRDTAAPGRFDSYEGARGRLAAELRRLGIRSEVGAPVVVEGRVWGALLAGTDDPQPLAPGAELRLASFAELIATAVSHTMARSELIASRARIVEAAYEQRRQVVRDLHDGAQQRFVHTIMTLQLARSRRGIDPEVASLIDEGLESARAGIDALRELARGIHPAVLTNHGLAAAVEALADRAPLPVAIDVPKSRYPPSVESAAYFVAAEALTNVAKYAEARSVQVRAAEVGGRLRLTVEDDGAGGARLEPGGGLSGLDDRVAALAGTLTVDSRQGAGTRVTAEIPLG